mmetsp:Transcript_106149/g.307172  ORF Transcript_106149/g.307172 Transcript_106149/m.307172 type:complete len:211 (+) Transcript_106149:1160-1792(+)
MLEGALLAIRVGDDLDGIFLVVHATPRTPDLTEGSAAQQLHSLKIAIEARRIPQVLDGGRCGSNVLGHGMDVCNRGGGRHPSIEALDVLGLRAQCRCHAAADVAQTLRREEAAHLLANFMSDDLVLHKLLYVFRDRRRLPLDLLQQTDDNLLPHEVHLRIADVVASLDNGGRGGHDRKRSSVLTAPGSRCQTTLDVKLRRTTEFEPRLGS